MSAVLRGADDTADSTARPTSGYGGRPASRRGTAVAALAAAFGIVVIAALVQAPRIQRGLDQRSRSLLADRSVTGVTVSFSGRDATLSGPGVTGDVVSMIAGQPGVRRVAVVGGPVPTAPRTVPRGSEQLPASRLAQQIVNLLGASGLLFAAGSADLPAGRRAVVVQIGALLAGSPAVHVQVAGHCDGTAADGGAEVALSRRRAAAVADLLVANGVARTALEVVGFGATQPAGDPGTAAGRAVNRRVDLTVLGG